MIVWSALRMFRVAFLAVLAAAATTATAQQKLERGPAHEKLDFLVGDWRGRIVETFSDGRVDELTSEVSYSWQMGGVWLQEDVIGATPIGTIYNRALITYDPTAENYSGFWIDTIGVEPILFRAEWIDSTTLEFDTGEFDYKTRKMRFHMQYIKISDSLYEMKQRTWIDGAQTVNAKGVFKKQ